MLGAVSVLAGGSSAPQRIPSGLDCRFLRGLPAGPAEVRTEVIAEGRTLTCVSVDIIGSDGQLGTRSTVTYADPAALEPIDAPADPGREAPATKSHADGKPWREPPGVEVPIITTFAPRAAGRGELGIATAVLVPWNDSDPHANAAGACLAADMCVGPPVDVALDSWIPHPNPDLSLRFASPEPAPFLTGHGRLEGIAAGLATVRIEVWSGMTLAAVGAASSLLLRQPIKPSS